MSYAQEDRYFGLRNSLIPNTHFLPLLLKAGEEILDHFWSLVPPQKPSDTQKNRPQLAQPALLLCPASNTPTAVSSRVLLLSLPSHTTQLQPSTA